MSARGLDVIERAFQQAAQKGRAALIPYIPLGYPNLGDSLQLVEAAVDAGADLVELGLPFSDPLADGPTIQHATHTALQGGMTVSKCLEAARTLRSRDVDVPLVFMGYYNPILNYGEDAFCRACAEAGVDGLIVPDLPPEEAADLECSAEKNGLALIYLLAPTSSAERVRMVCERSRGFVYVVSVAGTTGTRDSLPPNLDSLIRQVKSATSKPVAVGFGIASPEQAATVASLADGVIVGSAIVKKAAESDATDKVRSFVASLHEAMDKRNRVWEKR